ncbi:MAG TPA: UDP-3-O-(3-hydroxymyristoyl)glucosamine N-acyltransferase [Trueperaceae bacterium]
MGLTAAELATRLGGRLEGSDSTVQRLAVPGPGCAGAVVVLTSDESLARRLEQLARWQAAVVVAPSGAQRPPALDSLITVQQPRLALAQLTGIFDERPLPAPGIHPQAIVAPTASLGDGVRVGAGAIVGDGAVVGRGSVIGEGAVVGPGAILGEACRLHPRSTLLDGVRLGDRVIVHSGAVIGSDGFGYEPSTQGAVKLHHLGGVVIGDDVEIGANSCVDRGTLSDTVIGARTKIDNLCQIAHNVTIGSDCLIAGQTGIAGSTRVGDRVTMAGAVGVGDHLTIGDDATLGPRAGVIKSVPPGDTWMGFPAQPYRRFVRESYLVGKLERIWRFVRERESGAAE